MWFDDSDAEAKMLAFLAAAANPAAQPPPPPPGPDPPPPPPPSRPLDKATTTFLDLGCGNGSLLLGLRDAGWRGRLLGVDYSEQSVALARRVAESRRAAAAAAGEAVADPYGDVEFRVWDVLLDGAAGPPGYGAGAAWDVVLDKGTFDAVSLSGGRDAGGRPACEGYGARVAGLLRPGGLFLVTSCNWTEEELCGWFEPGGALRRVGRVEYRSFSFGGAKGQTITTLCFARVR